MPASQHESRPHSDDSAEQEERQRLYNGGDAHCRWEPSGECAAHREVPPWGTRRECELECDDEEDEPAEYSGCDSRAAIEQLGLLVVLVACNCGGVRLTKVRPQIRAEADCPGHWPAGGCQSSTLFPSGSMTQPNFPYSESSIFSRTLHPSSRKTVTRAWRSSTR